MFKLKSQYQEAQQGIETMRGENKSLAEEIRDMYDQLTSSAKTVHELEKAKKYVEVQKEDMQAALEAAEAALEQVEAKVVLGQLELANARQEIETRLLEKEEEFNNTRANHQRAIESMQASLDSEVKCRSEVVRQKRKLEGDVNELEVGLEHARRSLGDAQANIKKLSGHIEALQSQVGVCWGLDIKISKGKFVEFWVSNAKKKTKMTKQMQIKITLRLSFAVAISNVNFLFIYFSNLKKSPYHIRIF